jgi:hypothetical protein
MTCCASSYTHDRQVDWSREFLDISSTVVPICIIVISVLGDVLGVLPIPKTLRDFHRQLTSPFRNFLTLQDLGESPGGVVDVSSSKTRILAVSACLASFSSLVRLVLQLSLKDRESLLRAGIFCITWVSACANHVPAISANLDRLTIAEVLYFFQGWTQTLQNTAIPLRYFCITVCAPIGDRYWLRSTRWRG